MTFDNFLENLGCYALGKDEDIEAVGLDIEQGEWRCVISENDPQGLFEQAFYHNFNEEQLAFLKILYKRFLNAIARPPVKIEIV